MNTPSIATQVSTLQREKDYAEEALTTLARTIGSEGMTWTRVVYDAVQKIEHGKKAGDMTAKLNQEATATEELLRLYGWREEESLQMFLHRTRQPAVELKHSPEYMSKLLQDCENKLTQATDEIARLRDYIDHAHRTLNAALSASENAELRDRYGSGATPQNQTP